MDALEVISGHNILGESDHAIVVQPQIRPHVAVKAAIDVMWNFAILSEWDKMIAVSRAVHGYDLLFEIPAPLAIAQAPTLWDFYPQSGTGHKYPYFRGLDPDFSAFAMDMINPLPTRFSNALLEHVAPTHLDKEIGMCRLYLSKRAISRTSSNLDNLIIDTDTYELLRQSVPELPDVETVVFQMGEMLAHMVMAGFDGRGVEFVLAGSSERTLNTAVTSRDWTFYALDFDKVQRFPSENDMDACSSHLLEVFFANAPYFPRPRFDCALYKAFVRGFCSARWATLAFANKFFTSIQESQEQIDATYANS